jgi:hypothetical protein
MHTKSVFIPECIQWMAYIPSCFTICDLVWFAKLCQFFLRFWTDFRANVFHLLREMCHSVSECMTVSVRMCSIICVIVYQLLCDCVRDCVPVSLWRFDTFWANVCKNLCVCWWILCEDLYSCVWCLLSVNVFHYLSDCVTISERMCFRHCVNVWELGRMFVCPSLVFAQCECVHLSVCLSTSFFANVCPFLRECVPVSLRTFDTFWSKVCQFLSESMCVCVCLIFFAKIWNFLSECVSDCVWKFDSQCECLYAWDW